MNSYVCSMWHKSVPLRALGGLQNYKTVYKSEGLFKHRIELTTERKFPKNYVFSNLNCKKVVI